MATTVHEPPKIKPTDELLTSHGAGGWHDPPPSPGSLRSVYDSSPASRTGVWVGLAAITMSFVAFTSAMIVREGASTDWQHFTLPSVLYFDTVILLASSVTLEFARKRVAAFVHGEQLDRSPSLLWLWTTLGLGLLFVAGQFVAWEHLRAQGVYMATNPSSSFFYLFTALHALHVIGGLGGFSLVLWRISKPVPTLRVSTLSTVSYYWHYMSVLWIYLLLLLWTRI
ncbi:MAG: cytochrome c oxidase subunit 3 [Candidatus Korobacteraceae bacterium]